MWFGNCCVEDDSIRAETPPVLAVAAAAAEDNETSDQVVTRRRFKSPETREHKAEISVQANPKTPGDRPVSPKIPSTENPLSRLGADDGESTDVSERVQPADVGDSAQTSLDVSEEAQALAVDWYEQHRAVAARLRESVRDFVAAARSGIPVLDADKSTPNLRHSAEFTIRKGRAAIDGTEVPLSELETAPLDAHLAAKLGVSGGVQVSVQSRTFVFVGSASDAARVRACLGVLQAYGARAPSSEPAERRPAAASTPQRPKVSPNGTVMTPRLVEETRDALVSADAPEASLPVGIGSGNLAAELAVPTSASETKRNHTGGKFGMGWEEKPRIRRWRVELHRLDEEPSLGFEAEVQVGTPYLTVRSLRPGELVDKFNQENPDYALQEGDRIIAIGGVRGESQTLLKKLARLRDAYVFDIERKFD